MVMESLHNRFAAIERALRALSEERWKQAVGQKANVSRALEHLLSLCLESEVLNRLSGHLRMACGDRANLLPVTAVLSVLQSAYASSQPFGGALTKQDIALINEMIVEETGLQFDEISLRARGFTLITCMRFVTQAIHFVDALCTMVKPIDSSESYSEAKIKVTQLLNRLGISDSDITTVRVDHTTSGSAQCFVCDCTSDVRIVVPVDTIVGSARTLAHELGHAVYFRIAPTSYPWAFECIAVQESIAFALEYLVVWAEKTTELGGLATEVKSALELALWELSLRSDDIYVPPFHLKGDIVQAALVNPWSILDYALGKLAALTMVLIAQELGYDAVGSCIKSFMSGDGATLAWAKRFNSVAAPLMSSRFHVPESQDVCNNVGGKHTCLA